MQINQHSAGMAAKAGQQGGRCPASPGLMAGFLPAFRHLETGEVRLCRLENGQLAVDHLLDGLPEHWVIDRDPQGRPSALVYAIEPGFMRGSEFWRLEDFSRPALDG